jgi:hypothetical protein
MATDLTSGEAADITKPDVSPVDRPTLPQDSGRTGRASS